MTSCFFSLVIPCFNALPFLKPCLQSLSEQSFQDFEVLVVDNGSVDGTASWVKENSFSFSLRLLEHAKNQGYAGGVNSALTHAKGGVVVVLNSDLTFDPRFLEEIAKAFQNPDVELAALHVKNKDGTKTESLGLFLSPWLRAHNSKTGKNILGPAGAALAFRKTLLPRLALGENTLFDPRYFFLWEDVELALRAARKGIKTWVIENTACFHHGNATGSGYFYKQFLSIRNRRRLIHTYFPRYRWTRPWAALLYDLPRFLFFKLFNPHASSRR